ncbi:hypothetical protein KDI_27340 [Dictyobacter arantiisoli]|uniref:Uncharacterized protein n=1 Tax=Dictyobacter arantiisoli TaxID=2014874 RepID=A0A5A5TCD2_9CHLR|nr:hypothetical protein KDI_27340 [Dictyobacter arantiisoli]
MVDRYDMAIIAERSCRNSKSHELWWGGYNSNLPIETILIDCPGKAAKHFPDFAEQPKMARSTYEKQDTRDYEIQDGKPGAYALPPGMSCLLFSVKYSRHNSV